MSALANILLDDNYIVEGCDIDSYIFTETCLRERNVNIYSLNHPIPDDAIIKETEYQSYQMNWKPETRAKVIKEKGADYYNLLFIAGSKTILVTHT